MSRLRPHTREALVWRRTLHVEPEIATLRAHTPGRAPYASTVTGNSPPISTHSAEKGAAAEAIGCSRGGRSTKVHLMVDALGLPVDFEITVGERHDSQPAPTLIERVQPRELLADTAYD